MITNRLNNKYNYICDDGITNYIDTFIKYRPNYTLSDVSFMVKIDLRIDMSKFFNRWLSLKSESYLYMTEVINNKSVNANNDYSFKNHISEAYKLWLKDNFKDSEQDINYYIIFKVLKDEGIKKIDSNIFYPLAKKTKLQSTI